MQHLYEATGSTGSMSGPSRGLSLLCTLCALVPTVTPLSGHWAGPAPRLWVTVFAEGPVSLTFMVQLSAKRNFLHYSCSRCLLSPSVPGGEQFLDRVDQARPSRTLSPHWWTIAQTPCIDLCHITVQIIWSCICLMCLVSFPLVFIINRMSGCSPAAHALWFLYQWAP